MNEVLLLRHGATAGNLEKRYVGRTDEPLCAAGIAQAGALREARPQADRLFVSPLLRARQTAELAFPGAAHTIIDGLRETDFGIFEEKNADEMADDPAYRAWVDGGCKGKIPGGEDVGAFKRRCAAAFAAAMADAADGERAAFVTHGGCIMAILEAYARPARDFYDYHIGPGEMLRCVWEGGVLRLREA